MFVNEQEKVAHLRAIVSQHKHTCPRKKSSCLFYSRAARRCTFPQQRERALATVQQLEEKFKLGEIGDERTNVGEFIVNGQRYALNISASGLRKDITKGTPMAAGDFTDSVGGSSMWTIYVRDLPLEYTVALASALVKGMDLAKEVPLWKAHAATVQDDRDVRAENLQRQLETKGAVVNELRSVIRDIAKGSRYDD